MSTLFHELTFYLMYLCLGVLVYLGVERALFFGYLAKIGRYYEGYLADGAGLLEAIKASGEKPDAISQALDRFEKKASAKMSEAEAGMIAQTFFFHLKGNLNRHLWIIDTIVTAAPLLGLLGTILGIVDTFSALASSGVSDPKGVSAGIGTALYATALGISIALIGLVLLNKFQATLDRILEQSKALFLTLASHSR
jgi:biopolymer transport protein ExbB